MHLFVVDILLVSIQKFESINLATGRIYKILIPMSYLLEVFKQENYGKGIGPRRLGLARFGPDLLALRGRARDSNPAAGPSGRGGRG
jgi:hypothetical protein